MSQMLQSGSGEPAFRCVVAASLAYLVQPQDLLPDMLPGGYGFVDDALLLHAACALSWEAAGDLARAEEKRKIFEFIYMFAPDGQRPMFEQAVAALATTLGLMRSMDPMLAEITTRTLIANPLQPVTPQGAPSAGAASAMGARMSTWRGGSGVQMTWQNGNSMGINFPGGGGVATNGRDIFVL
jgi:uncharacterized membrane protein YkvA (DUF1232 family)